jgi:arylsulfatase A-like enzyme
MADHGEEFYEHGMSKHSLQLYNETIRVPFIFFGHRLRGTPARTKAPVSTLDVMPTVLSLLDIEGPDVMFGTSLFEDIRPAPLDFNRPIMAENFKKRYAAKALIAGDWKLIRWDSGPGSPRFELYNIDRDYGERTPVDDPGKLAEMRRLMTEILDAYRAMETPMDMPDEVDVETMEKLRSLGYID